MTLNLGHEMRFARLELRAADDQTARFEGYATVWEHAYPVYGGPELGGWNETMARGAATKTLSEGANRALLHGHDNMRVLATTRSGALTIAEDDIGLLVGAELDRRVSWIDDLVHQIEAGTVDEMSVGFYAVRSDWSPDYVDRRITEIKLLEASVVWAGANDATVATIARAKHAVAEARAAARPLISARTRAQLLAEAARLRV
jgi:HK97 family phage prohead protease